MGLMRVRMARPCRKAADSGPEALSAGATHYRPAAGTATALRADRIVGAARWLSPRLEGTSAGTISHTTNPEEPTVLGPGRSTRTARTGLALSRGLVRMAGNVIKHSTYADLTPRASEPELHRYRRQVVEGGA